MFLHWILSEVRRISGILFQRAGTTLQKALSPYVVEFYYEQTDCFQRVNEGTFYHSCEVSGGFCMESGVVSCLLLYACVSSLNLIRSHTGSQYSSLSRWVYDLKFVLIIPKWQLYSELFVDCLQYFWQFIEYK